MRVGADVVSIKDDKAEPAVVERSVAPFHAETAGHARLLLVQHVEVVVAQQLVPDEQGRPERTARIAAEEGLAPQVLLQVKLRDDPSKGGFSREGLLQAWPQLQRLERQHRIIGVDGTPKQTLCV